MTRNCGNEPDSISRALAAVDRSAVQFRRQFIRCQALAYDRERDLSRWIALPRHLRSLPEPARTGAIIACLKQALRAGLTLRARREWSWSRRRHTALLAALGGELRRLREIRFGRQSGR